MWNFLGEMLWFVLIYSFSSNLIPNKRYQFIIRLEYRLYFSAITRYIDASKLRRRDKLISVLFYCQLFVFGRSIRHQSRSKLFLYWSFVLSLDFSQGHRLHTRGTNNIFLFIEIIGRFAFQPGHSGRRAWRDWVWANLRVLCLHLNSLNYTKLTLYGQYWVAKTII